jgi:hypothetical protein
MTGSEIFKYDVRIRERMLRKGTLSEGEVGKHLESLSDVASQGEDMVLRQPALHRHDDGPKLTKSVPPAPRSVPPPASAPASAIDGAEGADDVDDDDWGENP